MHVLSIIKQAQGLVTRNAPAILTGVGVAGVAGTAYLTGKATFKAADVILEAQQARYQNALTQGKDVEDITVLEKAKMVWTLYLPAAGVASTTIVAIIYANRINAKRMAALLAAYTASDRAYNEYKDKVQEHLTGPKEQKLRDEVAQDRVNNEYDSNEVLFSPLDGKVLIREDYTGRYFWSTRELVDHAVNQINAHVLKEGSARLSDFQDLIGLPHVSTSDYMGWNRNEDPCAIDWSTCTTPDESKPVHSFEYTPHPIMDPERGATFR